MTIDQLIIKLILDPSGLKSAAPGAVKQLGDIEKAGKKVEGSFEKLGKNTAATGKKVGELEGSVKKMTGGLGKLKEAGETTSGALAGLSGALVSFLSIVGGTLALKEFVTDMVASSAAVDRFSRNIGAPTSAVVAWGNVAESVGGSAREIQNTLANLSKAQAEYAVTGRSSLTPFFNMAHVSLHRGESPTDVYADSLRGIRDLAARTDRATASNIAKQYGGFSQSDVNMAFLPNLDQVLAKQQAFGAEVAKFAGPSQQMITQLVSMKQQLELVGLKILEKAAPALQKFLDLLQRGADWISQHQTVAETFAIGIAGAVGILTTAVGALSVAMLGLAAATALEDAAASPFLAIIIAIEAAIGVAVGTVGALALAILGLWQDYKTWQNGGQSLIPWDKWEPGIKAAEAAIKNLAKVAKDSFGAIFYYAKGALLMTQGDFKGAEEAFAKSADKIVKTGSDVTGGVKQVANTYSDTKANTPKSIKNPNGLGYTRAASPETVSSQRAMQFFENAGMSKEEAAGLASQIHSESSGKTNAVGDNGAAFGLIQWHKDRQDDFRKQYGKDIRQASADEQMAFMVYELTKGKEQAAGNRLRGATSAEQAGEIASRFYVRPGKDEAARAREATNRGSYAAMIQGIPGATRLTQQIQMAGNRQGVGGPQSTTHDNSVVNTTHVGTLVVQTQATESKGIVQTIEDTLGKYLFTATLNTGLV